MSSEETGRAKSYLGDGAYIQFGCDQYEVVLTTENGIDVQNTVVLGPHEVEAFLQWLKLHGRLK